VTVAGIVAGALVSLEAQAPLTLIQTIELPHVEGRIDHLAVDISRQRLYVAALGNNTVEVLDVKAASHLKSLTGFHEPQGIAVVDDASLVAVANGEGEGIQLLDASTFTPGRAVRLGEDADNVRYDPATKTSYVGYGGGALAAIGAGEGKVSGEVKLPGHPESFQLEGSGPRIFINVPSADRIVVVDRTAMKAVASWPVVGARSNFPMALDESGSRLFVGCRRPAKVLVFDTRSGKELSSFDVVGDTDDLFYDAGRKRLYVSGGEGFVDVFDVANTARVSRLAHLSTAAGARTSLFVADQSRLYLAVPHRGSQRAEVRVYEAR